MKQETFFLLKFENSFLSFWFMYKSKFYGKNFLEKKENLKNKHNFFFIWKLKNMI